jgi:hypothetical protein
LRERFYGKHIEMAAAPDRMLAIYLADHLAAATAGVELVRRAARNNGASTLGTSLQKLSADIEDDRRALQRIVAQLGFEESKAKEAVAWIGEKVGRLKLNGQLGGYSPLSRVLELEALSVGIEGKLALWQSLQSLPDIGGRLSAIDLDHLAERAREQRAEVEKHRLSAVREAFALGRLQ